IAGDGELRPLAEAAAARRRDVVFLGPLDRDGVRDALWQTAVVVVASTWHDVLPTVVIEALAHGRPVLGTALGGIPYLVGVDDPARAGGWVAPPQPAALRAARPVAPVPAPRPAGPAP